MRHLAKALTLLTLAAATLAHAQTPLPAGDLTATIAALDQKLFTAYNTCDIATLSTLVSEDLEFYHDKTGLAIGRKPFLESIQANICGKVHRNLTPGTLEVHRMENFGALEMGAHTFTHPNHPDDGTGEARFAMLWHYDGKAWTLTRVLSYDHAPQKPQPK